MSDAETEATRLQELRNGIDAADREIVRLILERSRLVHDVGQTKKTAGTVVYRPDREKQVYHNIRQLVSELGGKNPRMPVSVFEHVYREIMSGSICIEGGPGVAYLGPEASFSHQATRSRFGASMRLHPMQSIPDVFRNVAAGRESSFGVVPVDNTTEGAIGVTLDMCLHSDLNVYAEHYIRVSINLMHHENLSLEKINKIYTLKIVREQCRDWLQQNINLSQVEIIDAPSSAAAARMAANQKDGAALASEFASETYGLQILARDIQDSSYNITRFFVIGTEQCPPTGDDKTSIVCTLSDRPGSLYRMLRPFENNGINMTRIESRTTRRAFGEYNFFIDFVGHCKESVVQKILEEITQHTTLLKVLGSYPRMDLPGQK